MSISFGMLFRMKINNWELGDLVIRGQGVFYGLKELLRGTVDLKEKMKGGEDYIFMKGGGMLLF